MEHEAKEKMTHRTDRLEALKEHLNLQNGDMKDVFDSQYEENGFTIGNEEYLVLTEKEADDKAREEIERSVWAFMPNFILSHCSTYENMSNWEYDEAKEALEKIQGHFAEGVNELIKAMIPDMDEFVEDAICADGRGHFISHYDGRENEYEVNGMTFYVYRLN